MFLYVVLINRVHTVLIFCISAECRGRNVGKLKRNFKLAISSDDINNRHKAGLRKIFRRRKRDIKDDEEIDSELQSDSIF